MWVRLDCTLATHRKMLRAGAEAAWLWVCGLAYANQHTTNGLVPREALVALYPCDDWTPAKRRHLVAKLVEVGLWEVVSADSWMIHGYAEHQSEAMSEAVEARREREREKKRTQRDHRKQSGSRGVSHGDTLGDTPGCPRPPSVRPSVRPSDPGETTSLLSPPPPAPTTHPLTLEPPTALKATKRAAKPKADKPPPPFSVADALGAIASTAGRRFTAGDATTWAPGWKIALAQHVRRFPDLSTWSLVGEWLAAGGAAWAQTHSAQWAAGNHLLDAVTKSQAWASSGRGVVDSKAAVAPVAVAAPAASQPHAPKKVFLGAEFAAVAKAAREGA